ncbi:MAG: outer membrane beta-barrel protein [Candidatus Omnitrophica bacterium]|nr:outer membrane beta-barrel protein [Candidatus Omnitrophota bacterium]
MKRLILLGIVLFLCLPMAVYAASIGGAETQKKGEFAVSLDSAFIFDRDLKFKSASGLGATQTIKNTEIDKGYQIMLKPSYGLFDNLDVYAKLGIADYEVNADNYVGNAKYADDKIDSDTNFAYGFGLKGTYELGNDWLIGCDFQYLRSKHEAKVTEAVVGGSSSSATYKKRVIQEWHIAPYIAKRIDDLTPYLGVRYSDMELEIKSPSESGWTDDHKYEADDNVGVFLGTDYKISENLTLNLEGRFVDETAMSFACTYKF